MSLKNLTAAENRPTAKVSEIVEANYALHTGIGRLARNQRIYDQSILTLNYVHRLDVLCTRRDAEWVGHSAILAALQARDAKREYEAMRTLSKTYCNWLPPRDSNPDMLLQRQLSYH